MTLTVRREHAGGAAPTTLASTLASGGTTISVTSATGWPTGAIGDFVVTLGRGTTNEERVLCASRTGNVLTVATSGRGWDGTVVREHQAGTTIEHTWSTTEADEASAHSSDVAAHGVTEVAGLTEVQSMSNKTLVDPTITGGDISSPTLTGTVTATGATIAGAPTISGNPNFSGAPVMPNFTNANHDHGDADDGGNIPQASVTGLTAALAAKLDDADRGVANGVASLDASVLLPTAQLPDIPIAKIPTGITGSTVSLGNHNHDVALASTDTVLTARAFGGGETGIPRILASTDSLAAGKYLILGSCRGYTLSGGGDSTRLQFYLDTSAGTLYNEPIEVRSETTAVQAGMSIVGYLENATSAVVSLYAERMNSGAVQADTSTVGMLIAIKLSDIT
jgi:hypothetical protein